MFSPSIPNNPLDAYVYPTSNSWVPNMKERNFGFIRPKLRRADVTRKQFLMDLKQNGLPIDLVAKRRQQREILMNMKAKIRERTIYDAIEQNQIERQFKQQQAEIQRLQNVFKDGILSLVFNKIQPTLSKDSTEFLLENDPDLIEFDNKTDEILSYAEEVESLQEENKEFAQDFEILRSQVELDIQRSIATATTQTDIETITKIARDYDLIMDKATQIDIRATSVSAQTEIATTSVSAQTDTPILTVGEQLELMRPSLNVIQEEEDIADLEQVEQQQQQELEERREAYNLMMSITNEIAQYRQRQQPRERGESSTQARRPTQRTQQETEQISSQLLNEIEERIETIKAKIDPKQIRSDIKSIITRFENKTFSPKPKNLSISLNKLNTYLQQVAETGSS